MLSISLFCIGKFVIYISCPRVILPLQLNYIFICIDMFVNLLTVYVLLCVCMLYNLIVGYTSSRVFCSVYLLCMGYSTTAPFYICVCINMFVNIISMFTAIFLCNS